MKDSDRIHPLLLEASLAANKLPVASPTPGLRKLLESLRTTAMSYSRYHESNAPPPLPPIEAPAALPDSHIS